MHCNMNYCILVTISRNSISFRYNRIDGDNRFVDMMQDGDREMPFAIECAGSEFIIGKSALEAANSGLAQNAYANIFDTCKSMRTFRFAGRDEQLNKLPYYAIKYYVGKILSDKFYGQEGTIDSNISKIPLMFLFAPGLDTDKKRLIISPFEKGGFQNICSISYHQLLLPILMDSLTVAKRMKTMVLVSVDNDDLLLQVFSSDNCKEIDDPIRVIGQGRDPRVKQAADFIWKNLFNYNYKDRAPENRILLEAATRFLNSEQKSVNDLLCMSDGSMQPYMLDRSSLDMSSVGEAVRLVSHDLLDFLASHDLRIQQCQVILVGKAASDYFENLFNQMQVSVPVKKVLEKEKGQMLDRLLTMVKKVGYEVNKLFQDKSVNVDEGSSNSDKLTSSLSTDDHLKQITEKVVAPSKSDSRKVKIDIADIRGKLRGKDFLGAYKLYNDLKAWIEQKGYTRWDSELKNILDEIDNIRKSDARSAVGGQKKNVSSLGKTSISDRKAKKTNLLQDSLPQVKVKTLRGEVRRKIADIKAQARLGQISEAVRALNELEEELHKDNVKEFDSKIQSVITEFGLRQTLKVVKSASKNAISTTQRLLISGKFSDAKRQYAVESNSEMVKVCSDFIRSKRDVKSFASGLESTKRNHDVANKQYVVKELENHLELYQKYGVDSTEIENLIEQYKLIK